MKYKKSIEAFERARKIFPGGVNSPVRAFKAVGGVPVFIDRGDGEYLFDIDDNRYVDFIGSWGPAILGHARSEVVDYVTKTLKKGFGFGTPSELESELGEIIIKFLPMIEKIRFVSSGTEATMSSIRVARGFTGRKKIIKFDGCYHGHVDSLLVKAGSGNATFGVSDSSGVIEEFVKNSISIPYNNIEILEEIFKKSGNEIAAVIVEPVAGNMGVVPSEIKFLKKLRELTAQNDSILIFDEVMSGFRVGKNSAVGLYGIKPDLICLGKIIGGGMAVGAFGGREDIMNTLSPLGNVYQAGTLSGNPIAMASGIKTLQIYESEEVYKKIERIGKILDDNMEKIEKITYHRVGGMFTIFFTQKNIREFKDLENCNFEIFSKFHHFMLERGFLLPPSQYEASFISAAHSDKNIEFFLENFMEFLKLV